MSEITEIIQPYDEDRDIRAAYELWQMVLAETWPIEFSRFQQVLQGPEPQHFVAREGDQLIGFAATLKSQRAENHIGHLAALIVAPHHQRQGIGSALHAAALDHLQTSNVGALQLGSIAPRFCCGLPTNLPDARQFFLKRGWAFSDTVFDLVQDLSNYSTPTYLHQRMEREQVTFETATNQTISEVLTFEGREFPNWVMHYEHCARLNDYDDILIARDASTSVVGTLLMYSPLSNPDRTDVIWQSLLGQNVGAMGAVGVASSERGRGIGLAIVARASEILKERGVGNCYIDWVVLTDFYARIGYQKWREYVTSWRERTPSS